MDKHFKVTVPEGRSGDWSVRKYTVTEERMGRVIEEAWRESQTRELPRFTLKGDLHAMAEQKAFLEKQGFRVGQNDVYPGLYTREDYERAVVAIWENEVEGWWNYQPKDFPKEYAVFGTTSRKKETMLGWEGDKPAEPEKPKKRDRYEVIRV